jgi:hypothetical protein
MPINKPFFSVTCRALKEATEKKQQFAIGFLFIELLFGLTGPIHLDIESRIGWLVRK